MSIDKSLKTKGSLRGTRSVLTRTERIAILTEQEKFDPEKDNALGLPKTRVIRSKVGGKKKKATDEEGEEGAE